MYIKFYNVWYIYFETGMYVNNFEQMISYSNRITLVTQLQLSNINKTDKIQLDTNADNKHIC